MAFDAGRFLRADWEHPDKAQFRQAFQALSNGARQIPEFIKNP